MKVDMQDRFTGCLFGLATGDALGSRLEGYAPEAVRRANVGMSQFLDELWHWSRGKWTDDTKMALALAQSIVDAKGFKPEQAAKRYLEWYESGDWRGIGKITQEALANLKEGASWHESGIKADWAAGNGTAMRVAPIGLLDLNDLGKLREDARNDAIITHNNHEAINGSFAIAFAVSRLAGGDYDIENLIPETIDFIEPSEVLARLQIAQKLFEQGVAPDDALLDIGTSGYVIETVASAFYCFITAPNSYETVVYNAIRAGNDTDTTAAVAGALAGAHLGIEGIPLLWRENVEAAERIEDLARLVYELRTT